MESREPQNKGYRFFSGGDTEVNLKRLFAGPIGRITPLWGSGLWQVGLLELRLQQQGVG